MNQAETPNEQIQRIDSGLVDTTESVPFIFNDRKFHGHPGDTLASASEWIKSWPEARGHTNLVAALSLCRSKWDEIGVYRVLCVHVMPM